MLPINEMIIYIPKLKEFMVMSEGSGLNLTKEDEELGYIDYIYIHTMIYKDQELVVTGEDMYMLTEPFDVRYNDYDSLAKDCLAFMYEDEEDLDYVRIETPLEDKEEDLEEIYGDDYKKV